MAKVEKFEDLVVFKKARELCNEIYRVTNVEPWKYDFRFVQQIRAAAGSIMDNIAEGYERNGNKEFKNFLYIAKGSCGEVRSQIIRASDAGLIDGETYCKLYNDCMALSKSLATFAKSVSASSMVGIKYFDPNTLNFEP